MLLLLLLSMLSDTGIVAFVPSVGSLMPSFDLFVRPVFGKWSCCDNQFVRSGQLSVKLLFSKLFFVGFDRVT